MAYYQVIFNVLSLFISHELIVHYTINLHMVNFVIFPLSGQARLHGEGGFSIIYGEIIIHNLCA